MSQPPDVTPGATAPEWPAPPPPGDWSAPGWAPPRRNGPAVASLFLGLLAFPAVLFLWPGVLLGVVALALGLIGRGRVARGEADAKGVATAGVVLGTVAIAMAVVWGVILHFADQQNQKEYEACLRSGEVPRVCVEQYDPTEP